MVSAAKQQLRLPSFIRQKNEVGSRLTPSTFAPKERNFCIPSEKAVAVKTKPDEEIRCTRCSHCSLPMGDLGYYGTDGEGAMVHGECMAQQVLQELRRDEDERCEKDDEEKQLCRLQYSIGWQVERIPRNIQLQSMIKDSLISHGLCCLVLQGDSKTVRLAATNDPSAAVNLEYLSLALQVRRKDGREPIFSLDPVNRKRPEDKDFFDRNASQVKRFEPEWLAGTSAGEVLFQADYHLKELSMGVCDQPVIGMKSCLDYSEGENADKEWSAREWFMVRKAEVQMSEDKVLIPRVQMGVEAREQLKSNLEDSPITRQDHPMVKYAETFTKNFDLIAERKSVFYHLRELAKASVLAKFLVDADVQVEEEWFNLAGEAQEACAMEIPQLWNERVQSRIRVKDGEIVGGAQGIGTNRHGVYGGVAFGLEKFDVSKIAPRKAATITAVPAKPAPIATLMSGMQRPAAAPVQQLTGIVRPARLDTLTTPTLVAPKPVSAAAIAAIPLSRVLPGMRSSSIPGFLAPPTMFDSTLIPTMMAMPPTAMMPASFIQAAPPDVNLAPFVPSDTVELRGVDLNLNQFSLDSPTEIIEGNLMTEPESGEAYASKTEAFWSVVNHGKGSSAEGEEDLNLLKSLFNPHLSDRRTEGNNFAPPEASLAYINQLRSLVKEEEQVKLSRKDHFFSSEFVENSPGPLFPSSWARPLDIARVSKAAKKQKGVLQPRPECVSEAQEVLKAASAAFERKTEDGTIFRIYRMGSLEVRTAQEHDGDEVAGAIFSVGQVAGLSRNVKDGEMISKATEYVERGSEKSQDCNYFTVLETEHGSSILTEMVEDTVTWEETVSDLEVRSSLAKVVRTASCVGAGTIVEDVKAYRTSSLQHRPVGSLHHQNRTYATCVYTTAVGGVEAALKASEERQMAWETNKDSDDEDFELENNVSDKVSAAMKKVQAVIR